MTTRRLSEISKVIDAIPWFSSVGGIYSETTAVVASWQEAAKYICDQIVWVNFRNAISNRYHALWLNVYPTDNQTRKRNSVGKYVDTVIARSEVNNLGGQHGLTWKQKKRVLYHLSWDIGEICWEYLYGNEVDPIFATPCLLPIYQAGHFPCGWSGMRINSDWLGNGPLDLPRGRLRVL